MEPPPLPGQVVGIAAAGAGAGDEDLVGAGSGTDAAASPPTDEGTGYGSIQCFAVRRGGGGIQNAIFLRWTDAEPHVTGVNAASAEYNVFGTMEEAVEYLVPGRAAPAPAGAAAAAAAGDKRKRTNGADEDEDYDDEEEEVAKKTPKRSKSKKSKRKKAVAGRMAREPTEKWNSFYDRLVHYHATHGGSTKIATADKPNDDLRKWLVNQRSQLNQSLTKAEEQGETVSPNLQSKVDKFEALGVDIRNSNRRLQYTARWDEMYVKLSAYKEAHGDCLVPTEKAPEHSQLATWVYQQQKEYRKLKEGNSSKLTADHVVKLNDIGFVFERREKFLTWEERLEQLRQFKAEHGHLKVPTQHPELGQFTSKMRREYREFTDGMPNMKISADTMRKRVADLTEMGFVFQAGKRITLPPKHLQKNWDQRFEELLQYKDVHGHCVVPQSTPGLGEWVHRQRKDYKALKEDKPTRMTAARAIKLQEVGFVFDTRDKDKGKDSGGAAKTARGSDTGQHLSAEEATIPAGSHVHVGYQPPIAAAHAVVHHAGAAAVAAGTHAAVYGNPTDNTYV